MGSAGTVDHRTYLWLLQHGGLGVVGLFTWCLRGTRVSVLSEHGGSFIYFYDLASKEMQYYSQHVLWVMWS